MTSALRDMNMARSALPEARADVQGVVGFMILTPSTAEVKAGRLQLMSPSKVPCSGPPTEYMRITARGRCPSTSKAERRLSRLLLTDCSGSLNMVVINDVSSYQHATDLYVLCEWYLSAGDVLSRSRIPV